VKVPRFFRRYVSNCAREAWFKVQIYSQTFGRSEVWLVRPATDWSWIEHLSDLMSHFMIDFIDH
jgi:hypothetical protein